MSRNEHPLDELVDGIRERSERAFSAVYQLTASSLASYANGMLRDRHAAEDAVQQAFLELARSASGLQGNGRSLRAWLFRSVRFNCLDELRRRKRRPEEPTEHLPDEGIVGDAHLPDPALAAALMQLTEKQRSLVVLRYVSELTPGEIAEVEGVPRTTVYAALARAERRLRKLLMAVESTPQASSVQIEEPPERGGPS